MAWRGVILIICAGLFFQAIRGTAQERAFPIITAENVDQVGLYADLGTALNLLFIPTTSRVLIERTTMKEISTDYGLHSVQSSITEVWSITTRQVEATLDAPLGLVSEDGRYMLSSERLGFSLWDLETFELVYRYEDEVMLSRFQSAYISEMTDYLFLYIAEDHAYIGSNFVIHVIDLVEHQEIDRTYKWCEMPDDIARALEVCQDKTGNFSMRSPEVLRPVTGLPMTEREYSGNNLVIEVDDENRPYKTHLASLIDETIRKTWIADIYSSYVDISLSPEGQFLIVREDYYNQQYWKSTQLYAVFVCQATVSQRDVNLRDGPGQSYQQLGTYGRLYEMDQNWGVIAQSQQPDGIWWQLVSGAWLRSDFATGTGDCEALPEHRGLQ